MILSFAGTQLESPACRGPHHLWQQEQMIYFQQRSKAVARALDDLFKVHPYDRVESTNDTSPQKEDFRPGCGLVWKVLRQPH